MKYNFSIDACDDLIGQGEHRRMDLHSEEVVANENAKNKTQKISFV